MFVEGLLRPPLQNYRLSYANIRVVLIERHRTYKPT